LDDNKKLSRMQVTYGALLAGEIHSINAAEDKKKDM
jgi:hypothetical protein